MNSVMEIGDKIIFLVQGEKVWEGNNKQILKTNNKLVNDFVYSSELLRKVGKLGVEFETDIDFPLNNFPPFKQNPIYNLPYH